MSTSTSHSQRHYHESNSRTSDVRGDKTSSLGTFRTERDAASHHPHRGSSFSQDTSRHYGTQPESRTDSQSQEAYHQLDTSYRRHDTSSHTPHHQLMAGVSRRYHGNPSHSLETMDSHESQHTSHQRHPNLSLDTRNLPNSRPSPFTPSDPTAKSPPFPSAEIPSHLHTDLNTLKSGLESLWNLSSKKLHSLHSTLTAQADSLRSLNITNANLESTLAQRHAALSQEIERLGKENSRLIKDAREAEEGIVKALREREMLSDANARLWEDKARLEGEKRELRVKLDAETDFARLCQRELEKVSQTLPGQRGKVKMEDDEDNRTNHDLTEIRIPLVHVEELIERRLHHQAHEFTRESKELYVKLAQYQTRITELEGQFKRYSAGSNNATTSPPFPPQPNSRSTDTWQGKTPPAVTPVTPHTALPSSVSENDREYPFGKTWSSMKIPEPNYGISSMTVKHGDNRPAQLVDPREVRIPQRTTSGSLENKSAERDVRPRRESLPTLSARSGSYSNPPMDPTRLGKHVAPEPLTDANGQVVSTYAGVVQGWRPAPASGARSPPSQSASHSRPATPDRPLKRARTVDAQDVKHQEESSKAQADVDQTSNTAGKLSGPSERLLPSEEFEQSGREMTDDERLMFNSLSRVLVKKRDNDGWKCVLCRQEKKSPTATFSETTPIGVVTLHVKGTHKQFWDNLRGGEQTELRIISQ